MAIQVRTAPWRTGRTVVVDERQAPWTRVARAARLTWWATRRSGRGSR